MKKSHSLMMLGAALLAFQTTSAPVQAQDTLTPNLPLRGQIQKSIQTMLQRQKAVYNLPLNRARRLQQQKRAQRELPTGLTLVNQDLSVDPNLTTGAFSISLSALMKNEHPAEQTELQLWMPKNLTMRSVKIGDTELAFASQAYPQYDLDLLTIQLGAPVPLQQSVTLLMQLDGTMDCSPEGILDIKYCAVSESDTVFSGLQLTPYFENDSGFDLHLTHAANLKATASGDFVREDLLSDGRAQSHFHGDHSSQMYIVGIGDYEVEQRTFGALKAAAYTRSEDGPNRKAYVDYIDDIIDHYSQLYYPYAFQKLEYIGVPDGMGFSGMAGASLLLLAESAIAGDPASNPDADNTLAHETGHQWFAYMYPSNEWQAPWLSEGITSYLASEYSGKRYSQLLGKDYDAVYFQSYNDYYVSAVSLAQDKPLTSSYYANPDPNLYVMLAYIKGPLVTNTIAQYLGGYEAFGQAIHYMGERHLFEPFDTAALQHNLEEATGKDLQELFEKWVFGKGYPTYTVKVIDPSAGQGGPLRIQVHRDKAFPAVQDITVYAGTGEKTVQPIVFADSSALDTELSIAQAAPLYASTFDAQTKQLRRVKSDPAADINLNGEVDAVDLVYLAWAQDADVNSQRFWSPADLNSDGKVDATDLQAGLDNFAVPNQ